MEVRFFEWRFEAASKGKSIPIRLHILKCQETRFVKLLASMKKLSSNANHLSIDSPYIFEFTINITQQLTIQLFTAAVYCYCYCAMNAWIKKNSFLNVSVQEVYCSLVTVSQFTVFYLHLCIKLNINSKASRVTQQSFTKLWKSIRCFYALGASDSHGGRRVLGLSIWLALCLSQLCEHKFLHTRHKRPLEP